MLLKYTEIIFTDLALIFDTLNALHSPNCMQSNHLRYHLREATRTEGPILLPELYATLFLFESIYTIEDGISKYPCIPIGLLIRSLTACASIFHISNAMIGGDLCGQATTSENGV